MVKFSTKFVKLVILVQLLGISVTGLADGKMKSPTNNQHDNTLISEWLFDGNLKDSLNNSKINVFGDPTFFENRFGKHRTALNLNGRNDYFYLKPVNEWKLNNEFSLECWVKFRDVKIHGIVSFLNLTIRTAKNNRIKILIRNKNKKYSVVPVPAQIETDKWYQLFFTYKDGTAKVYLNGSLTGERKCLIEFKKKNFLIQIGKFSKKYFNGCLDDFRLYNRAFDEKTVKALYYESNMDSTYKKIAGGQHPVLFLPLKKAKIDLDGKFIEPVWEKLTWNDNFRHHLTGKSAKYKTKFKTVRTADGLYFAIRADGEKLNAKVKTTQNAGVALFKAKDDIVEIYFASDIYSSDFKQFIINSLGSRSELGNNALSAWQCRTSRDADGYNIELFFPNEVLGMNKDKKIYSMNVCREAFSGKRSDVSSWSRVNKRFNRYFEWGKVVFGRKYTQPDEVVKLDKTADAINITLAKSMGNEYSAYLNYLSKTGNQKSYPLKKLKLKIGLNSIPLASLSGISGGKHFLTIVSEKDNIPNGVAAYEFKTVKQAVPRVTAYQHPVIIPEVKKTLWGKIRIDLKTIKQIVYYATPGGYEQNTAEQLQKQLLNYDIKTTIIKGRGIFPGVRSIIIGSLKSRVFTEALMAYNNKLLSQLRKIPVKKQGYLLSVKAPNIICAGQDAPGGYYAFRTLLQIIRFNPDAITEAVIVDWPDIAKRGIALYALIRAYRSKALVKKYIFELVAGFKYNMLQVDSGAGLNNPDKIIPGMKISFREFISYIVSCARENHVEIVPSLNTFNHATWLGRMHPELFVFPEKYNVTRNQSAPRLMLANIEHPDYYKIVLPFLKKVYNLYGKSPAFNIGHDEFKHYYPSDSKLYEHIRAAVLSDIIKQGKYLKALGVKDVYIWADMIMKNHNGGPPMNISFIADKIPNDIIIPMPWHSDTTKAGYEKELFTKGFNKIILSSNRQFTIDMLPDDLRNIYALFTNCWLPSAQHYVYPDIKYNPLGQLTMQWSYLMTTYAADLFWNAANKSKLLPYEQFINTKGNAIMKITAARKYGSSLAYKPVALPMQKQALAAWKLPGNGFDFNTIASSVKSKFKPLLAGGTVVLNDKQPAFKIRLNQKVKSLAILHSLNFSARQLKVFSPILKKYGRGRYNGRIDNGFNGPLVADYKINYADGSTYVAGIHYGYNIYQWNGYETTSLDFILYDASEMWSIPASGGNRLDCFVYELDNPYPNKKISSIVFDKKEKQCEIVILSVVIGK
jgi:Concanavalin A-like lectin/glucanases superfamily/Glycosyl hydrolase family 20, catalytic domain/Glycosyl hydrolase family 20, domain 2